MVKAQRRKIDRDNLRKAGKNQDKLRSGIFKKASMWQAPQSLQSKNEQQHETQYIL